MRHLLLKSSLSKTNLWKAFTRGVASEPVVQCNDGADKNGTLGQRWQQHENQVLIEGMEKQELEFEKVGRWNAEQNWKEKWEEIENFCHSKGINRSAEQCRKRWQRLMHAFFKIKSWESCIPPGKASFWLMKASEKKVEGLPFSLDWNTFNAIDLIQNRKELWLSTCGFSSAEEVSIESPSSDVNSPQVETDDLETPRCDEAQHQLERHDVETQPQSRVKHQSETDDSHTATSISNDEDMHALEDVPSTALMEPAIQVQKPHYDDRPPVLVRFVHQCLVDLEGLDYDSCDSTKSTSPADGAKS